MYLAVVLWDIKCTACFGFLLGKCLQILVVCLFAEFYKVHETWESAAPWRIPHPKQWQSRTTTTIKSYTLRVRIGSASWKCKGLSIFSNQS